MVFGNVALIDMSLPISTLPTVTAPAGPSSVMVAVSAFGICENHTVAFAGAAVSTASAAGSLLASLKCAKAGVARVTIAARMNPTRQVCLSIMFLT